ncbi:SH3 domain-containing protein [Maribacter sp.]|uniref:SH3 domain-containing protein n=1 Tax=Maribacter sp. TaxID=1897614 RepID=UPI0025C3D7BD|nr:SH3 domain-containing protein [Maribacter sp.]
MKHIITGILLISLISKSIGQVATIEDKDGYTNVREEPNAKSKIVYQIKKGEVFWFAEEDYYSKEIDWIQVEISKNNYSLECGSLDGLQGFVHKSKLKPLNKKEKYLGDEFVFEYVTKPFTESNKIIDYQGQWISTINGLHPWGVTNENPEIEIEKISLTLNGNKIEVSDILISDIYECNNQFNIYKTEDTYFVHQQNGKDSGAYEIVWVISENKIKQRLIREVQ